MYQLIPIEVKKHPPVTQDDTPCLPERQPPVIDDDTNHIQSERDPKKGRSAPLSASLPEDQVIEELADIPGLVHDRRFREGTRRLLAEGRAPGEIARAVRTAAGDPRERGSLSFIADRFPRWTRKALERERWEHQLRQHRAAQEERQERERNWAKEREQLLLEREDPYWQAQMEAALAQLPWRRVRA